MGNKQGVFTPRFHAANHPALALLVLILVLANEAAREILLSLIGGALALGVIGLVLLVLSVVGIGIFALITL